MKTERRWLTPLTGVVAVLLAIVGFAISGDPPDATEVTAKELVAHWTDKEGARFTSALLEVLVGTLWVFFGAYLRRVLRDATGGDGGARRSVLPDVVFAGSCIFATGLAIDATIALALTETAADIDPTAVQTLSALYMNDFLPFALGTQLFFLATGLSVLRYGGLPKWIGWVALFFGVIAVTPAGFVSFVGGGLLVAVTSVVLTRRAKADQGDLPAPDASPAGVRGSTEPR